MNFTSIYAERHRRAFLAGAGALILLIAFADWGTKPYISIGFLYLFPIFLVAGFLPRWQLILVALGCAGLQELFSELPTSEAITRLLMASAGFVGTGLFVAELIQHRRTAMGHLAALERQTELRREVEEQLRILVESSPVAVVTLDAAGDVLLANDAAQELLEPGGAPITGQPILGFLPALHAAVRTPHARPFRTELRCRARRKNGEAFLAAVWFSTYLTAQGPRLAAIIVDLSEELRDREDLSLDHLLKSTKILMGAMSHEIRNLSGAVLAVHGNLSRVPGLQDNEDFRALGTLIQGLGRLSAMELGPAAGEPLETIDLSSVLDELRVLIETPCREAGVAVEWQLQEQLPLVFAEAYGLAQAFLNLARNAIQAMATTPEKRFLIASAVEGDAVVIRFQDTGVGIPAPDQLFKPFQPGANTTGLGLYVSRALLRSCGGELTHEPRPVGCCFAIRLPVVAEWTEVAHV